MLKLNSPSKGACDLPDLQVAAILAPLATDGGLKLDVCRKNLDPQQNQRQKLSWRSLKVEIPMFWTKGVHSTIIIP